MELLSTTYNQASKLAKDKYSINSLDEKRYEYVQSLFKRYGKTLRKDMPRIRRKNILLFRQRLEKGYIDINKPYANSTDSNNIFKLNPNFLINGIKDGDIEDDKININITKSKLSKLKPIQKQIYLDEIFDSYKNNSKSYFQNAFFLCTKDNSILDGHHRFVTALLFYPNINAQLIKIDLELNKLLPMSVTYTKAIGNKMNEELTKEWDKLLGDIAWYVNQKPNGEIEINTDKMSLMGILDKYNISVNEVISVKKEIDKKMIEYIILLIKNFLLKNNYKILDIKKFIKDKLIKKLIKYINDFNIDIYNKVDDNIKIVKSAFEKLQLTFDKLERNNLIIPLQYTIKS